ncbi:hypothetical protein N665_0175s0039 [Sinapis alba]|nr:hypothetical protein N665_0175s0039 [Sinapis alba]
MFLSVPKSFHPGIKSGEEQENQVQRWEKIILQLVESINVRLALTHSVYTSPIPDIMHLFLVQNALIISGTNDNYHKKHPPEKNLLLLQVHNKKASLQMEINTTAIKGENTTTSTPQLKERTPTLEKGRGIILSYLLKGEPPDAQPIPKPTQYRDINNRNHPSSHQHHQILPSQSIILSTDH